MSCSIKAKIFHAILASILIRLTLAILDGKASRPVITDGTGAIYDSRDGRQADSSRNAVSARGG